MNFPSINELLAEERSYKNGKKTVNAHRNKYRDRLRRIEFAMHLQDVNKMNSNTMKRKFGISPGEITILDAKLKKMRNRAPKATRHVAAFDTYFVEKNGSRVPFMPMHVALFDIMKKLKECNALPKIYETKPRLTLEDVKRLIHLHTKYAFSCQPRNNVRVNNKTIDVFTTAYKHPLRLPNRKHHQSRSSNNGNVNSNNDY